MPVNSAAATSSRQRDFGNRAHALFRPVEQHQGRERTTAMAAKRTESRLPAESNVKRARSRRNQPCDDQHKTHSSGAHPPSECAVEQFEWSHASRQSRRSNATATQWAASARPLSQPPAH